MSHTIIDSVVTVPPVVYVWLLRHSSFQVVHPAHVEDTRSLDMWKSSLEKLRSWIGRRKRQCLEDAVASAIRAVDKDSDVDGVFLCAVSIIHRDLAS